MSKMISAVTGMEPAARCFGVSAAIDLTALPRCGVRGPNAYGMLRELGYAVPEQPNTAIVQESGELLARLSASEYLLLADREADTTAPFSGDSLKDAGRFYRLERFDTHAWFVLTGALCGELMAKLCGVDLRAESSPAGIVVQTSVARTNAIVIRQPMHGVDALSVLVDRSFAMYFREVLDDAMHEYGGQFIDGNVLSGLGDSRRAQ
ncbi:sarcosine oxidase subunit gamma family protein [Burkholderia anthina]|uniref:sarcosine oxidase subunit gamma family protein n=1 Tax=Burkholderia anthina TaxID=179879 RepID=UPI001AA01CCD|nr:sarcosine oxidase subunit gamma family protein [Burkholderia anthina]QTD94924.1 sarcosine oxidase [Burkholderia anthina]